MGRRELAPVSARERLPAAVEEVSQRARLTRALCLVARVCVSDAELLVDATLSSVAFRVAARARFRSVQNAQDQAYLGLLGYIVYLTTVGSIRGPRHGHGHAHGQMGHGPLGVGAERAGRGSWDRERGDPSKRRVEATCRAARALAC